ncbi:MAG: branched-chain amino acid ABC transporter substrate-binding protein [Desulfovibrio sp.]|jgi:branched-chain amino acid transport system substrate-binding protein|nr:branched-chain amino acid ABC transporter substrate-binding protein [Desulfovibrio sp.]
MTVHPVLRGLVPALALIVLAVAAPDDARAAAKKQSVKVGFIGPLTGGVSANGLGGRNSAELAVMERNENPDSKFLYEYVALDDECKPNIGVQVATKMAADRKVIGAVTHYCSAVALGTVDIYHRFGMPVIVWGAVQPDITYGNDYPEIMRICGTMINQNEEAAKFMRSQGYKKFAILHDTTDYGKSHKDFFIKYLTENGGEVLGVFGVTSEQQDFTAELTRIKALNPEVIYFGGLTPLGVRIRSQMDKLGINAQFEGVSGIKSDSFIEGLGKELAEGCLSFVEATPVEKLPDGQAFLKSYAAHNFAQGPEAYGPFAYAAMTQILSSIEKVGPDRKKVTAALNAVKDDNTLVGKVVYDDHGQNIVPIITKYVVQDGVWTIWEDSEYASGKRSLKK